VSRVDLRAAIGASVVVVGTASPRRAAILSTIEDKGHFLAALHADLDLALGDFSRVRAGAAILDLALAPAAALAAARRLKAVRPGMPVALVAEEWEAGLAAEAAAAGIRPIARRGPRAVLGLAELAAFLAEAAMAPPAEEADLTGLAPAQQPAWTRLPALGAA
jgi:hypothetical protein